jgi:hypothetical protein
MAHRAFRDADGRSWEVWDVQPSSVERRAERAGGKAFVGRERRRRSEPRVRIGEEFRDGWLAFQSGRDRRRLAPVPTGWAGLRDDQLIELLARSTLPTRSRRLIE